MRNERIFRRSSLVEQFSDLGLTLLKLQPGSFFNESHSLSTAALASRILHRIFSPLGICAIPLTMCFCVFSSTLALLLTFVASGFTYHLNIGKSIALWTCTALKEPHTFRVLLEFRKSPFEVWMKHRRVISFGELLAIWSLCRPRLRALSTQCEGSLSPRKTD